MLPNRDDDERIATGKWTIETLRIDLLGRIDSMGELTSTKLDSLQRQLTSGFEGSEKSVLNALVPVKTAMDKAELTNDKRFDSLTLAAEARDRVMTEKLNVLTQAVTAATASAAATAAAQHDGKTNSQWSVSTVLAFLAMLSSVGMMIFIAVKG